MTACLCFSPLQTSQGRGYQNLTSSLIPALYFYLLMVDRPQADQSIGFLPALLMGPSACRCVSDDFKIRTVSITGMRYKNSQEKQAVYSSKLQQQEAALVTVTLQCHSAWNNVINGNKIIFNTAYKWEDFSRLIYSISFVSVYSFTFLRKSPPFS